VNDTAPGEQCRDERPGRLWLQLGGRAERGQRLTTPCNGVLRNATTPRGTAWPLGATVSTEHRAPEDGEAEDDRLERVGHGQHLLSLTMPKGRVGKVDQRGPPLRPGVQDFEDGLEIAIQVHGRGNDAFKDQRGRAGVPPAMGYPAWKAQGLTGLDLEALATSFGREDARGDPALLVFHVVHMEKRSVLVGREGTPQLEDGHAVANSATDVEDLAGVTVHQMQSCGSKCGHESVYICRRRRIALLLLRATGS